MNDDKKMKQEVSDIFSKLSPTYGEARYDFFSEFGRCCLSNVHIKEDASILDVATGKGAMLFPALGRIGHSGNLFGIDISPGMIKETGAKIEKKNAENVKLQVMDGDNLDFEDNRFDLLTCGFALFFFPDVQKTLAEFKRVLKPNGQAAISTWFRDPDSAFAGDCWFWKLYAKYVPCSLQKGVQPDFGTKEGMFTILDTAGFKEISIIKEEKKYYYADEEEWWQEQLSHGGRRALDTIPKERLGDFKKEVFAKLQDFKDTRGVYNKIPVLFSYGVK